MKSLVVIAGPTASGKSKTAAVLAKHFQTEIINADSRQFFKGMPVGTAWPSADELMQVRHHFIGHLNVTDTYNVGQFEQDALILLNNLFQKHEVVILTGGSGLYLDAVTNGLHSLPPSDPETRAGYIAKLESEGIESLQKELLKLDPLHYTKIDIHNPHRLIRALEMITISGMKMDDIIKGSPEKRDFQTVSIGLLVERETLYQKINHRVDEMIENGLEKEVRSLLPYRNQNALQTVGYKELFSYFDGEVSLASAIDLIKQHTRNYAKRQMTWLRRKTDIRWFDPSETSAMINYISEKTG